MNATTRSTLSAGEPMPASAATTVTAVSTDGWPVVGVLPAGPLNALSDVKGVTVGHVTRDDGATQTGVTVIRPHAGDVFLQKVPAAVSVINGFGKSVGLMQVAELGQIETPIALSNTFAVGTLANAQIRHACEINPEIGRRLPTVNPLVFECNDGYLNDIQAMAVSESDYRGAYEQAAAVFAQGSVGAGRGMSCFDLKGGIGSASRCVDIDGERLTVGVLVLANFGRLPTLTVRGVPIGHTLAARRGQRSRSPIDAAAASQTPAETPSAMPSAMPSDLPPQVPSPPERGSIIMIVATDAPVDTNQLRRIAARAGAGLARTGSVYGHGSGDVALAFTTAYTVPQSSASRYTMPPLLHPATIDPLFTATADAVEQAIIHALWHARGVTGRDGHHRIALTELAADWPHLLNPLQAQP